MIEDQRRKQAKAIQEHGKEQTKEIEWHGKEMIKYNELRKNDFIINKDGVSLKKQEEILSDLTKEKPYEINAL